MYYNTYWLLGDVEARYVAITHGNECWRSVGRWEADHHRAHWHWQGSQNLWKCSLSVYITHSSKLSENFWISKALYFQIACELVHLALGSSTGTWNDTWVSALIKIFMVKPQFTTLVTKTMQRRPWVTTALSQNYFPDTRKGIPLN